MKKFRYIWTKIPNGKSFTPSTAGSHHPQESNEDYRPLRLRVGCLWETTSKSRLRDAQSKCPQLFLVQMKSFCLLIQLLCELFMLNLSASCLPPSSVILFKQSSGSQLGIILDPRDIRQYLGRLVVTTGHY